MVRGCDITLRNSIGNTFSGVLHLIDYGNSLLIERTPRKEISEGFFCCETHLAFASRAAVRAAALSQSRSG